MKKRFQKLTAALMLSTALAVTIIPAQPVQAAKGTVKSVTITAPTEKDKLTVYRNKEDIVKKLKVSVKTTGSISKAVKYSSSKSDVVSVSDKGTLKCKKPGKATITVKSKANSKKRDKLTITVKQNITSLKSVVKDAEKTSGTTFTVKKGKKYTIANTIKPSNASDKTVSYGTSNKKVATVSKSGKITAKAEGTAKIVVAANDKSGKKAVLTVKVSKDVTPEKKTYTVVAPAEKATATVKIGLKNNTTVDADVANVLKLAGLKKGSERDVKVDGKAYTAKYDGSAVTFNGKKLSKIATGKSVTVEVSGNFSKLVSGIISVPTKKYDYALRVGDFKIDSITAGKTATFVIDGKNYKATASNGKLVFSGDVTKVFKPLKTAGLAAVKTIQK